MIYNEADAEMLNDLKNRLENEGAKIEIIAPSMAPVKISDGTILLPHHSLMLRFIMYYFRK
ncbi:hypothetical protein [Chryseobacterium sp. SIMBA_029]|uniref:hypothetical protein n=1 Tax=Chryseobacterium sp. SIMBA_029 TaxID=3085772 RepID=UPI0039781129